MIVKDETHIIEECLKSMLPYIDRHDITDTGSTGWDSRTYQKGDGQAGVPGEVYLSDWKGFGDSKNGIGSRTEALTNCDGKADYAWMIDVDDFVAGDFVYPTNFGDFDALKIQRGDFTWWRNQIFKQEWDGTTLVFFTNMTVILNHSHRIDFMVTTTLKQEHLVIET